MFLVLRLCISRENLFWVYIWLFYWKQKKILFPHMENGKQKVEIQT